jgi:hypothetical protein
LNLLHERILQLGRARLGAGGSGGRAEERHYYRVDVIIVGVEFK